MAAGWYRRGARGRRGTRRRVPDALEVAAQVAVQGPVRRPVQRLPPSPLSICHHKSSVCAHAPLHSFHRFCREAVHRASVLDHPTHLQNHSMTSIPYFPMTSINIDATAVTL
ncbi:uncharacterized protein TrAtP1_009918 [Trichoderma atroviride]|uniref:uncharacterized protein n=1 Tax=Hypocrea atroviridis TaxID=63577 RepID=UPI003316EDAF|nr:hypothetical protein TrAtP1_009918 [Trichoderma atroviride]